MYVPKRNVANDAAAELRSALQDLEIAHLNFFILVDGEFNHCRTILPTTINMYSAAPVDKQPWIYATQM